MIVTRMASPERGPASPRVLRHCTGEAPGTPNDVGPARSVTVNANIARRTAGRLVAARPACDIGGYAGGPPTFRPSFRVRVDGVGCHQWVDGGGVLTRLGRGGRR